MLLQGMSCWRCCGGAMLDPGRLQVAMLLLLHVLMLLLLLKPGGGASKGEEGTRRWG